MKFPDIRKFADLLSAHVVYSTYYPINAFYAFCKSEFAPENFEFLMLARTFNPALGPAAYDFFPANIATPAARARHMYLTCVDPSAPRMVNLDAATQTQLGAAYESNDFQATSFDAAHDEILALVQRDTFRRFQDWPGNDAMPGINTSAYTAAKAARANNAAPAAPVPLVPPVMVAAAAPALLPQAQIAVQPHQGFHRPMVTGNQLPVNAGQAAVAVPPPPPAPALPAVVVAAPPAVADRAREIERDLPKQTLRRANAPLLIIRRERVSYKNVKLPPTPAPRPQPNVNKPLPPTPLPKFGF